MKNKVMKLMLIALCTVLLCATYISKSSCGMGQETWITEMMVDLTNKDIPAKKQQEQFKRKQDVEMESHHLLQQHSKLQNPKQIISMVIKKK